MREIKFRGKRKDNGEWVYGNLVNGNDGSFIIPEGSDIEFQEPDYYGDGIGCGIEDRGINDRYESAKYGFLKAVDRCAELHHESYEVILESIGQYSGWKDREGKDLYEGDIVQRWQHDDNTHKHEKATVWYEGGRKWDIKEIKFLYGSFVIWSDLINDYRCFANLARPGESLELLGNTIDNPELLNPTSIK